MKVTKTTKRTRSKKNNTAKTNSNNQNNQNTQTNQTNQTNKKLINNMLNLKRKILNSTILIGNVYQYEGISISVSGKQTRLNNELLLVHHVSRVITLADKKTNEITVIKPEELEDFKKENDINNFIERSSVSAICLNLSDGSFTIVLDAKTDPNFQHYKPLEGKYLVGRHFTKYEDGSYTLDFKYKDKVLNLYEIKKHFGLIEEKVTIDNVPTVQYQDPINNSSDLDEEEKFISDISL